MSRSIYWKITIPFILLIVIGMSILGFFLTNNSRNMQMDHLEAHLTNEARLIADTSLNTFNEPASNPDAETLAKTIGQDIGARVTLISLDGTVLGDTWENPAAMENHASRPEVTQALQSGVGESFRFSTTTGQNMLYIAVPVTDQGQTIGIARVAMSLDAVNNSVNSSVWTTALTVALTALLVIVAASLITRRITHQTRQATRAAMKIAAGHFDHRIDVNSDDELGRMGHAFNKMSVNLKEMMTTISDERSKLQAVLATLSDGIIMTDPKGQILMANPAAENLFNFTESQAVGKPLIEAVFNHEIEDILKKSLGKQEKQIAHIDTTTGRFLRVVAVPLKAEKVAGGLLLFQDLTELRSLQTMRREFVGNVSHELRTPLAGIKAIVETLQDGAINDEKIAREFLGRIEIEVDSLTQMVNELIELSRIETGKTHLDREPLVLNAAIQEVVNRLSPQAERKQIEITMDLSTGLPLVEADQERIQEVITNILHNAIKFTPENGKILIRSKPADHEAVVTITDTGPGISREDLPHIFERFFKADRSRAQEGSGLGLAISKHIIQAHGGRVWVESQEGHGATFGFSLPTSTTR